MTDSYFLEKALYEAKKSFKRAEIPIGALIVLDNKIIARAYNLKETRNNPIYHAEIIAIQKASAKLKNWRLQNTTLYTTLEPCPMCAGAIIQARIPKVVYGAKDSKFGAITSKINLFKRGLFNHNVKSFYLENSECKNILQHFFQIRRKLNKEEFIQYCQNYEF